MKKILAAPYHSNKVKIGAGAILLISIIFLIFGANLVQAAVGACGPCTVPDGQQGECDTGLICKGGKCRGVCPPNQICNPLQACDFQEIINAVINFIFYIALAVAPLLIIYAGILFVTAGVKPEQVGTAKNIIIYTLIGLAVIFLAKGLYAIIEQVLGVK